MKKILLFLFITTLLSPLYAEDYKMPDGFGEKGTSKIFDNRTTKSVKDMKEKQKKIDTTDPRNQTTDPTDDSKIVQNIASGDSNTEQTDSTISTQNKSEQDITNLMDGGSGDKKDSNGNFNNQTEKSVEDMKGDSKKIDTTDPRNNQNPYDDYRKVFKIFRTSRYSSFFKRVSFNLDFSSRALFSKLNLDETKDFSAVSFQGKYNFLIDYKRKTSNYKIGVGSINPYSISSNSMEFENAPENFSRWSSFGKSGSLSPIITELSVAPYSTQKGEVRFGRFLTPFENSYMFSNELFFDGFSGVINLGPVKINALASALNSSVAEVEIDNLLILHSLMATATFDKISFYLGYVGVHGDDSIEHSIFNGYADSIIIIGGVKYSTEMLKLFANGSFNVTEDSNQWGFDIGSSYRRGDFEGDIIFSYKKDNSIIKSLSDEFFMKDIMGGKVGAKYFFEKNGNIALETAYLKSISNSDNWSLLVIASINSSF